MSLVKPHADGTRRPPTMTAEQRAAAIEAKRTRAASLRSDFPTCDEQNWAELAARYGYRLPPYGVPVSTAGIRRTLRALGIEVTAFQAWYGERRETLAAIAANYQRLHWPQKALSGLILEALDAGMVFGVRVAAEGEVTPD